MNNENNEDSRAKRILKMIQERQEDNSLIPKQSARDLLNRFKEDATEEELKEMYCSPVYEEGFRAGQALAESKIETEFIQHLKTLKNMIDLMINSR